MRLALDKPSRRGDEDVICREYRYLSGAKESRKLGKIWGHGWIEVSQES